MAGIPQQKENLGVWLPNLYIWDTHDTQELLVRLYQNVNNVINSVNTKASGLYLNQETNVSLLYFILQSTNSPGVQQLRAGFRIKVVTGALPNTGTITVPHGIPFTTTYTLIGLVGQATDHTGRNYIPLPYASPVLANNIELRADATNIYITTGSNRSNFDFSWVTLEYLKN